MAEMKQFGIDLELDDAVAQGHYSNLAIISHSTSEFIIDFATVLPGVQKARVKSRIILTPEHAKRLLRSLQENIVRYESNVGKIEIPSPQPTPVSQVLREVLDRTVQYSIKDKMIVIYKASATPPPRSRDG